MRKMMPQLAGTLTHSNKKALFLHAPLNFARTETSRTRTQLKDATSCSHQREKGHASSNKGSHSLLFTKGSKGKRKGHGKGKGKPGKSKGLRKGKAGKGKQPKGLGRSLDGTCRFCKQAGHYKAQCPKFAALTSKTVL